MKRRSFLQTLLGLAGATALPAYSNTREQQKSEPLKLLETREPLIKSWMNSLSPARITNRWPIAALASTCNSPAHKHISIAFENSESQSASPRLNQRSPNIAGFYYYEGERLFNQLNIGDPLQLRRAPKINMIDVR